MALRGGLPAAVFERQGRILRIFEKDTEAIRELLSRFVKDFQGRVLFAGQKRLIVKSNLAA